MNWCGLPTVVSALLAVSGQKSCLPGFTNYWRYGCYWVDPTPRGNNNVNWADSEARCQEFGPNVHLAGIESMEEMIAVTEDLEKSSWYWLGGKYNSTSGKYYWVGSGDDADLESILSPTSTDLSNKYLVLMTKFEEIKAWPSSGHYYTLCEEY